MQGKVGLKSQKPIPARGAGLKSRPIPAPPPLWGKENPHEVERGGAKLWSIFICFGSSQFGFYYQITNVNWLQVKNKNE